MLAVVSLDLSEPLGVGPIAGENGAAAIYIELRRNGAPVDPANRFYSPALGGGALLDLGVYVVGLSHLVLGAPSEGSVALAEALPLATAAGLDSAACWWSLAPWPWPWPCP